MPRRALVLLVVSAGCRNLLGIDGDPRVVVAVDASGCTRDDECPAICDVATGTCVECTIDRTDSCPLGAPYCVGGSCAGCRTHADCESQLCLPAGTCADADAIAYVQPTGFGIPLECSLERPCATCTQALSTGRPYVKVTGTITGTCTVERRSVAFFGAAMAGLTSNDSRCVEVFAGTVEIHDLTLKGCAVEADDSAVTVVRSTVRDREGVGIRVQGGSLVIARSTIASNSGGGIRVDGTALVDITNSFIYGNGSNDVSAETGGIRIGTPATGSRLEHNTIANNLGAPNSRSAVSCDAGMLVAPNNLVVGNQPTEQVGGTCQFDASFVTMDASAVQFRSAEPPYDFHLGDRSIAIDAAASTTLTDDGDGEPRPQGAAPDFGADEAR